MIVQEVKVKLGTHSAEVKHKITGFSRGRVVYTTASYTLINCRKLHSSATYQYAYPGRPSFQLNGTLNEMSRQG